MLFPRFSSVLNDRDLRRWTTAISAGPMAPEGSGGGGAPVGFDPFSPQHNLDAWIKIQSDLRDDIETYGWYSGRLFAVVGDEKIEPLMDMEGFGCTRTSKRPDGSYTNLHRECGFYKDVKSGEILEEWHNPYLDRKVKVAHIHNDPVNSVYAPFFEQKFGADDAEPIRFPFILPWTFMEDKAFTSFDVNAKWKNSLDPKKWKKESTGEFVRTSEYLQFHFDRSELEDPEVTSIESGTGAWQRIGEWLPWMLMGGKPGHLFYRFYTKKLQSLDALTPNILKYTQDNYAKWLSAPTKWTEPNVTSFEVYALENEPAE